MTVTARFQTKTASIPETPETQELLRLLLSATKSYYIWKNVLLHLKEVRVSCRPNKLYLCDTDLYSPWCFQVFLSFRASCFKNKEQILTFFKELRFPGDQVLYFECQVPQIPCPLKHLSISFIKIRPISIMLIQRSPRSSLSSILYSNNLVRYMSSQSHPVSFHGRAEIWISVFRTMLSSTLPAITFILLAVFILLMLQTCLSLKQKTSYHNRRLCVYSVHIQKIWESILPH